MLSHIPVHRYIDLYNNPKQPLAGEHRDIVLEILSDARIAAPMLQTGLIHSRVNPRSYMYVFGHNSRAGEYANVSVHRVSRICDCDSLAIVVQIGCLWSLMVFVRSFRRASSAKTCRTCSGRHWQP